MKEQKDNPKRRLAVIMSVYKSDKEAFVRQAVESILSQTCGDFDLYILFDGPVQKGADDYLYALRDERVHIMSREKNKGLAFSLNELLEEALPKDYEYIARMDADDVSLPERFEKQISYLDSHPDMDCAGSWAIEINADGSEYFRKQMPVTHDECRRFFMKRDCLIHPTVMFRRSYFEKAGLYPTDTYYAEDTLMWAKGFVGGCRFSNVPDYLLKFRLDADFFNRRRGWKLAKSILLLRWRVNHMLHYPLIAYIYALLYAIAKMMPMSVLSFIYRKAR